MFVEANEKDAKVEKADLIITDETRIRRKQGDSEIEATFEQLKVGDEIEAIFVEGPIVMIYPMRVAVSEMLIVKTVDAGQDQDKKRQAEILPCLMVSFASKSRLKKPRSTSFEVGAVIRFCCCMATRKLMSAGIGLRRYLPSDLPSCVLTSGVVGDSAKTAERP